jgi:hypothetical protein
MESYNKLLKELINFIQSTHESVTPSFCGDWAQGNLFLSNS